MVKLTGGARLE